MIREDFKRRSQVKVVNDYEGKRICLRTYRFDFIPEPVEVPYCSWANLDCCGGWSYDEEYLDTAVQKGLKLFAGRATSLKHPYAPNNPTLEEAHQEFEALKSSLPAGCFADIASEQISQNYFYTFICRTGRIADYIDLEMVFQFYEKLGCAIPASERREVEHLCDYEISRFGTSQSPFDYARAFSDAELITTGLLLGYPIESTVSILQGY